MLKLKFSETPYTCRQLREELEKLEKEITIFDDDKVGGVMLKVDGVEIEKRIINKCIYATYTSPEGQGRERQCVLMDFGKALEGGYTELTGWASNNFNFKRLKEDLENCDCDDNKVVIRTQNERPCYVRAVTYCDYHLYLWGVI